jgi:hypothetical protein
MPSNLRSYSAKSVASAGGVNDTAGAALADSAMQTWFNIISHQRWHWHRWCRTSGVNDTAQTKWPRWCRGPGIREALVAFKGDINQINQNYIGKLYYPIPITIIQKYRGYLRIVFGTSGVTDTAGAKTGFERRISSRIRSRMQKAWTRESGAQVGLFDEKTRGWKSCDTDPLNKFSRENCPLIYVKCILL